MEEQNLEKEKNENTEKKLTEKNEKLEVKEGEKIENKNNGNFLDNIQLKEKEKLNEIEKKIDELKEKEIKNIKLVPKTRYIIVVVHNITPNVTEKHLKEIFSNYGETKGVYIPINQKTKLKKNYAFIEFVKEENAEEAQLYMDEGQIDGRVVKVEILSPKNYIKLK